MKHTFIILARTVAVCAFVIFLFPMLTHAQQPAPSVQWEKFYGGNGEDVASSIHQTVDGGYIATGYSNSTNGEVTGNHGEFDYWVIKIDHLGNLQWEKCFGGMWNDNASNEGETGNYVLQTNDGGYIISGASNSADGEVTGHHGTTATTDYWIVKTDAAGNIQWENSFGGSSNDFPSTIRQTNDGGYIVAGVT